MRAKWMTAVSSVAAILGMFLPFYNDQMLAGLPLHISLTGAAMFGEFGVDAAQAVTIAKALAYLLWLVPLSAALMIFAAAVGEVDRTLRASIGILWIAVVAVIPTLSLRIAIQAVKPLFPQLADAPSWMGPGTGGWMVVMAGVAMVASSYLKDSSEAAKLSGAVEPPPVSAEASSRSAQ